MQMKRLTLQIYIYSEYGCLYDLRTKYGTNQFRVAFVLCAL